MRDHGGYIFSERIKIILHVLPYYYTRYAGSIQIIRFLVQSLKILNTVR